MTKFSVSIIAKNREVELAKCLRSVKGADEIVVLDTGSTDNTPRVATDHGAKVFYYKWENDFSAARNKCLEYVNNSWVLSIDSDETLKTGVKSVYETIDRNFSKHVIGVRIDQPTGGFYNARIFKRESAYWERRIHEELNRMPDATTDSVVILHNPSVDHIANATRNIDILRDVLAKNPLSYKDAFYLGEELLVKNQPDAAVYWLKLFIELSPVTPQLTSEAYYLLAECYCKLNRCGKAINSLISAVKANPQMKAAYDKLYRLTKNDAWLEKSKKATNQYVLKIR